MAPDRARVRRGGGVSPCVDPVAFVLGVLGVWVGLSFALAALWLAAGEWLAWRARRRARCRRGVGAPAGPVVEPDVDVDWRWPAGQ